MFCFFLVAVFIQNKIKLCKRDKCKCIYYNSIMRIAIGEYNLLNCSSISKNSSKSLKIQKLEEAKKIFLESFSNLIKK